MIVKHYKLRANETSGPAPREALNDLARILAPLDGVLNVDLGQDVDEPERFILIERWHSEASYTQGSQLIDESAFKAVFAQLDAHPELATLASVCAGWVDLAG